MKQLWGKCAVHASKLGRKGFSSFFIDHVCCCGQIYGCLLPLLLMVVTEEPSKALLKEVQVLPYQRPLNNKRPIMSIKRWHKGDFDGSPLSSPSPSVSVLEVECVREGCQSETLRQMAGSVPEGRCLTVVFKGARKSLDLLCQSQEEAQHWVRGIRTLQERVENMTEKEKLDQYPVCVLPDSHIGSLTVRWWEQSNRHFFEE